MRAAFFWLICAGASLADGEPAGDFDYFVLSLSWSPTWCALEGEADDSPQCDRHLGWVLHGLWPQDEQGWPSYCRTTARDPSRTETAAMADIMGDSGAAWYQWKKHGRCAGMPARVYFGLARRAFASIRKPDALERLGRQVEMPASVVEEAFLAANPDLSAAMVTVTCRTRRIEEVRICLTRDLVPRQCSADVARDCSLDDALLDPIR